MLSSSNSFPTASIRQIHDTYTALHQCWETGVFLPNCLDRFVALSFQILSRFHRWFSEGLASLAQETASPRWSLAPPHDALLLRTVADTTRLLDYLSTPLSHDPSAFSSSAQDDSSTVPAIDWLQQSGGYLRLIRAAIDSPHLQVDPVLRLISQGLNACTHGVSAAVQQLSGRFLQKTSHECAERLQPLLGIAQTYRMMDRPVPSKPSFYVDGILQPAARFFESLGRDFPEALRGAWQLEIATEVCGQFFELASGFRQNLSKQNTSFKRLIKPATSQTADPALPQLSDEDKIDIQLSLDIQAFGRSLKLTLGIAPEQFPPFKQFDELIALGQNAKNK